MKLLIDNNIPAGALNSVNEVFESKNAQRLILEEKVNNIITKRVKTTVFKIK